MLFNFGKLKCLHTGLGNTGMNYEMGGTILSKNVKEKYFKGRFTRPICDLGVGRQVTAVDARHKLTRCLHDRHRQGQAT